jgi:protein-tyrosine sulfotransferase
MTPYPSVRARMPVFLVGCHRSGTTLARVLINAHDHLVCPPESKFIAALRAFIEYPQVSVAFDSLGLSKPRMYEHLRALTVAILDDHARQCGKARWIDKTPNYYRYLDFIDELFDERVLFVFMVRHPFDTIHSLEDFGRGTYTMLDPDVGRHVQAHGTGRVSWAMYWNDVNTRLLAFAAARAPRCTVLRYEDLVRDPDASLSGMLDFIGETLTPNMVERAFAADLTSLKGYGDGKVRRTTAIHDQSLGKWREWTRRECQALWRIVGDVADALGYLPEWSPTHHGCHEAAASQTPAPAAG